MSGTTWIWFRILATHCARALPEISLPSNREGAGKTGCALHPRSRVRFAQNKVHTSITCLASITNSRRWSMTTPLPTAWLAPSNPEGAGNAGCALHPRSRVRLAQKSCTRAYRAAENIRHSLRSGFTAYIVLSPVGPGSLSPSPLGSVSLLRA